MPAYEEPRGGLAAGASDGLLSTSVRTAGSLGLVLAVIGLGVVAVRRLGLRGRWTGQASDGPRVLARTYLGPKESLCVVRVGAEVLLLGVSSQQISLLCKLEPTAPPARAGAGPEEAGLFQRHLRQMAGQGEGPADVPALEGRLQRIRTAWGLGKE
jgi:flagellar protein FliO/FliZ